MTLKEYIVDVALYVCVRYTRLPPPPTGELCPHPERNVILMHQFDWNPRGHGLFSLIPFYVRLSIDATYWVHAAPSIFVLLS